MGKMYHLSVGCGDATIIRTDSVCYLVDCNRIEEHAHLLPTDQTLHGVFITHHHEDHYSGLRYLKQENFAITYLIACPYSRRHGDLSVSLEEWEECEDLIGHFERKGSKVYRPYRQSAWNEPWWSPPGLRVWMLGPDKSVASSEGRELHDGCLVFRADLDKRRCTFTGDASDVNLTFVANNTTNICDDILHASHHGSINGADLAFIKKCAAKYTVISTETGVHDNVPHPTALKRYADHTAERVYRTDDVGTVAWSF